MGVGVGQQMSEVKVMGEANEIKALDTHALKYCTSSAS